MGWRLFLYMPLGLSAFFLVGELAVLTSMRLAYPAGYNDPFAPYEAMMPGQPVTANSGYFCAIEYPDVPYGWECNVIPTDAPPCDLGTALAHNNRFEQTRFLAEGCLYIGDIVQHWGRPESIVRVQHQFHVRWKGGLHGLIEADGPIEAFSYMVPVKWLTVWIEDQSLPSG